ncbi:SH3 domain-containing protein [Celeribacter baekdonensis]|uniref:SH3 domain-containing protein n=1 Tax=Celeribacter baekdonensis TaxID=875171 RepID=UPI0030D8DBD3|tara:strand:- start:26535 stop:26939 length:405 start_codon:yes stop_codon:yes gene_type:complete
MKHGRHIFSTSLLIAALAAAPMVAPFAAMAQSAPRPMQQQQQLKVHVQDQIYVRKGVTLNGRAGPGTQYHKLFALHSGTQLKLLNQQGGWAEVQTPQGQKAWVSSRYLMCDGTCGLHLGMQTGPQTGMGPGANR